MKDTKSFVKLFDLNIPNIEHFDYYIKQLSKTQKFKDIQEFLEMYKDSEDLIGEDAYGYRKNKSDQIIEFVKSTNAYNELCYDKNLIDYPTSQTIHYDEKIKYISIDLRSANWIALKNYDPVHINELGDTYEEFLTKFDLPKVFIHSKYLRQFIFGNVNPKRLIKVQRNLIQEVVRNYQDRLILEGVRNDEAIFSFDDFSQLPEIVSEIDPNRYKVKIFTIQRVEDFRIDSVFDVDGNFLYKEMLGVDGTQFFVKLKEYITSESLDIRDLYFRSNGKLALWCHEKLNTSLNV
jgi:hypothetical protein